jgi:isopentenyl diphosphate isomerase/L-lactate dehydrogenase-like FMN-dependent dehydrogenase
MSKPLFSLADFEIQAQSMLPTAQWNWVIGGAESGRTYLRNLSQFKDYELRPRVLAGITSCQLGQAFFGKTIASPVFAAPVGHMTQFHEEGELAVMQACSATGTHCVVSMHTRRNLELLAETAGDAGWSYQVYLYSSPDVVLAQIVRAIRLGAASIVLTVDSCHRSPSYQRQRSPWDARQHGLRDEPELPESRDDRIWTWEMVAKLVKAVSVPLILKGVQCVSDAERALEIGCSGVWLSNHGGRNNETDQSLLRVLSQIRSVVGVNFPLVVDGGFRSGSDIVKALLLGATYVAMGRPLIFGVVVNGARGAETVLKISQDELVKILSALGIGDIGSVMNHKDQIGLTHRLSGEDE